VLGVSGYDYNPNTGVSSYTQEPGDSSNYYTLANIYPVSGYYLVGTRKLDGSVDDNFGYTAITPPLPAYRDTIQPRFRDYFPFGGTSAAVPQISALAYHLYSRRPASTRTEVANRIINTRRSQLDIAGLNLKGPASYADALSGW